MRVRFRVFGVTLVSLTFDAGPLLEIIEEPDEDPPSGITGGAMHNFDRDFNPLAANHEEPWYEDRNNRFGFRK